MLCPNCLSANSSTLFYLDEGEDMICNVCGTEFFYEYDDMDDDEDFEPFGTWYLEEDEGDDSA